MNTMTANRKCRFFFSFIIVLYATCIYSQERPKMERFLTVKPTSASFGAEGGSKTFTVSASGTWKISSNSRSWIHLSKDGNSLNLRVDENSGISSRSGSFELVAGEKKVRVSVTQSGGDVSLSVSSDDMYFNASGGTKTVTVTTNGTWQIGSNTTSWGHVSKNGNQLSIRADRNNSSSQRSGSIVIKAGNKEKRVYISQSGSSVSQSNLTVSSDNLSFSSTGGSQSITISASETWNIGTNTASWGHLTKNGNQLSVRVDQNTKTSSRTDWFSVKAGNKEKRINITQSGSSTTLSVSSEELSFNSSGGSQTIVISANDTWNIGTNTASWGHLTKDGNLLRVTIDQNNNTSSRSDWFTIKSGNYEKRINITQSGQTTSTISKSANIKTVSVYNDIDVDGKKGVSVHVSFNINGMKGKDARVVAYFYDSNGKALVNTNGSYGTTGSTSYVSSGEDIKPSYDNALYSDLEVKIPYDELHLSGTYSRTLRVDIVIWDYTSSNHAEIARKENTTFTCIPSTSYLKIDGSTSNKTKYFGEAGGREYYNVSTSANSYETWGVPSWCSIENKTLAGFTLVCNRNANSSSRNDYMLVKAAGREIRIDITQAGSTNTWGISGTSRSYIDNATGLTYITSQIKEKGECRLGAITENGKGIVIYGNNGAAWSSVPNSLSEKVKEIKGKISSITMTNSGYYCITYDRNGWYGIVPENMKAKLNQFNNNREEIRSISICENGSFAIVTDEHFIASNTSDHSNMKKAYDMYGSIKDVCVTNKGICVVCQNGIYYSNIPSNLEEKLKNIDYHPDHVTYTDSGTFLITTESGRYSYHM